MCTVSFVPLGEEKFILTSNRDETTARGLASSPQLLEREDFFIACPVDPLASGTWIAGSDNGKLICLLNGAFKKHKRQLPYRMSRGIVVLDFFNFPSAEKFVAAYDLSNIEPFTMVMVNFGDKLLLHELRWDGNEKYFKQLDESKFHLWSSATLYTNELIAEKETSFRKYLSEISDPTPQQLIDLHRTHYLYEDWVKPPLRVQEVCTLSVTSIPGNQEMMEMFYRDLVRKELPLETIRLTLSHGENKTAS